VKWDSRTPQVGFMLAASGIHARRKWDSCTPQVGFAHAASGIRAPPREPRRAECAAGARPSVRPAPRVAAVAPRDARGRRRAAGVKARRARRAADRGGVDSWSAGDVSLPDGGVASVCARARECVVVHVCRVCGCMRVHVCVCVFVFACVRACMLASLCVRARGCVCGCACLRSNAYVFSKQARRLCSLR
jgi:hypothetical protein